jgi:hypothetical protein
MSTSDTEGDDFARVLSELARTPDRAPVPQTVGHFRLLGKIGQGGMGAVYKAEDRKLGRLVALKCVTAAGDEQARVRLRREARAAAALSNPSLVSIYSIEEHDGVDYIVMEYVDGEPLDVLLARGPLPVERLISIGAEIADALACAHAAGLVHRDIKPGNVIVTKQGLAKVLDFGLAKYAVDVAGAAPLTSTGALLGTAPYMSPEQLRGESLDGRSDIFALGGVLYEMATGRRAFGARDLATLVEQITHGEPQPPSTLRVIPQALEQIILRALAKTPALRFDKAEQVATALRLVRRDAVVDRDFVTMPARATIVTTVAAPGSRLLFGRDRELGELQALIERAAACKGALVLVTGDAGLGKTQLVEALLARVSSSQVIVGRGRCVEQFGAREAYLPLFDLFEDLLVGRHGHAVRTALNATAPTWAMQLHGVATADMRVLARDSLGATKDRMVRELGDALGALGEIAPLVLVIEDVHWAEPSTIDALEFLAQRLERRRALVITTLRANEAQAGGHPLQATLAGWRSRLRLPELALRPLTEGELGSWLSARFSPSDFSPALAAAIHLRSDGHPLFASAMIEWLVDQGVIANDDAGWHARAIDAASLGVPESLRGMLRAKLDALSAEERRVLDAACVQGVDVVSTVVADAVGVDDIAVDERLTMLARMRGLLSPLGDDELPDGTLATRWRFTHAVYRDVLYDDIASIRRVSLHRQVAASLRKHHGDQLGPIAGALAVHAEQARDFEAATAHRMQAGDNAMSLLAAVEADRHYAAALADAERLPAGQNHRAAVPVLRQRALAALALGRSDAAIALLRDGLTRAELAGEPALIGAAHVALADALLAAHQLDEARPHVDAALALGQGPALASLRMEALAILALDRLIIGELEACRAALDERERVGSATEPGPLALHLRGLLHYFWSEYDAAETAFARAAEDNERALADGLLLMESRMFRALALANRGRLGEALTLLLSTLEQARRNDNGAMAARIANSVGWIYREIGLLDRALEYDRLAIEVGRAAGESEAEANALVNLVEDALAGGAPSAPEPFARVTELAAADAWLRFRYTLRLEAARARQLLTSRELEAAAASASALLALATEQRAGKYIGIAHELAARIAHARGDRVACLAGLEAAARALQANPSPLVEWRVAAFALDTVGDVDHADRWRTRREQIIADIARGLRDGERAAFLASASPRPG